VKTLRISLAVFAAVALLTVGAVVALAAPGSLGRAAAPQGGAAQAVYCPTRLVKQLKSGVNLYRKRMVTDRVRYFRTHKKAKQRAAFVRLQSKQLTALQKRLKKCS
jgi:hypothetical protein